MPIAIPYMGCMLPYLPICWEPYRRLFSNDLVMNDSNLTGSDNASEAANWKQIVARYQKPSVARAVWQLVNTFVPYIGALGADVLHRVRSPGGSPSRWRSSPAQSWCARFIIFHDCGHGSFFKSRTANHICGRITGVLTFTPYYHWRWEHAMHHSSSGDLDRRGTGDIWTLTVQEYLESSRWKRFAYRLARNPVHPVRPCAAVPVPHPATLAQAQGAHARTLLGLLDQSRARRHRRRPDRVLRPQGVI